MRAGARVLASWLALVAAAQVAVAEEPGGEGDRWRPHYHFTAPSGWLNDPNGLYHEDGVWHLHYQHRWPRHWGHASSRDLVNWRHRPIALAPDELGDCWSGDAVLDESNRSGLFGDGDEGGAVILYTAQESERGQRVALATRAEGAEAWSRFPGNPVARGASDDFRDPAAFWHEPSGRWVMIVTEGDHFTLHGSKDLREWERLSRLEVPPLGEHAELECPDLFPLPTPDGGETWVFIASYADQRNFGEDKRFAPCGQWFGVGDFDGTRFEAGQPWRTFDHGPDAYASITWPSGPEGRRVLIGWMNHWGYANALPDPGWKGCMTLPRELSLVAAEEGRLDLAQRPVRELWEALERVDGLAPRLTLEETTPWAFDGGESGALRMKADFGEGAKLEARFFGSGDSAVVMKIDPSSGRASLDRGPAATVVAHPNFRGAVEASLPPPADGGLELTVLWDRSTLEVFIDGGRRVFSALVFPREGAERVELRALGGDIELSERRRWRWREP